MDVLGYAERIGADLTGVADLRNLEKYGTYPSDLLQGFSRGVSLAVQLTDPVLDGLPEYRELYAHEYRTANDLLDRISFRVSGYIEDQGFRALPIPASQTLEAREWRSFISHKSIAREAGLGWIGKSLLLVNRNYGPRIRLGSVLTDMPLDYESPVESLCGSCRECIEACPAGALKFSGFEDYPEKRSPHFRTEKCVEKLENVQSDPDIGEMICGICIKACPFGG